MSRASAEATAWKNVVVTRFAVFCRLNVKAPVVPESFEKREVFELISSLTVAALTAPTPPCVTTPEIRTIFFFEFSTFARRDTAPSPTNARASTVPAAFGTPVPAAYGVQKDVHSAGFAIVVKTLFNVSVESRSCAPLGERPGEP